MHNWVVCVACLWLALGHLSAVEAGQQVEPASGSVRRPVPIMLAAEQAVKELVARQVKLLESSPLSLTPVPRTLRVPANRFTNVAGFLLKMGMSFPMSPPRTSALERYELHRLDAPPQD